MIDLYLRFADEAECNEVLFKEVEGFRIPIVGSVDVIGVIYKGDPPAPVQGWHANLRGDLTDEQIEALKPYSLDPAPMQPVRVWL